MPQTQIPTYTANDGTQLDPSVVNLAKAIRQQESGTNYNAVGDAGTSMGAYQWNNGRDPVPQGGVPINFQNAAKQFGLNPDDFSPANQDKVAYSQIAAYKAQGYSPAQIASMWNSGSPDWQGHQGTTTINGHQIAYDTPQYVQNVINYFQAYKQGQEPISQESNAAATTPQDPSNVLPTYGATFPGSSNDNGLVYGLKTLGNVPSSAYGLVSSLVNTVIHPIQTLQNLGGAAVGAAENLTGENAANPDQNQQLADAIGHYFAQRYGGVQNVLNSFENDPVGVITDIVGVVAGGEGIAAKGADLADVATGSRAAVAAENAAKFAETGVNAMPAYGAAGQTTRNAIDALNTAALNAAKLTASPVTGGISRISNALFGGVTNEEALAASARTGIDLPAAAYTDNQIVRAGEALAATGAGAAQYGARVDAALAKMSDLAQGIVESTGGTSDLTEAGANIAAGLEQFDKANGELQDQLFSKIRSSVGDVAAKTDATARALDGIISAKESIADTEGLKYFKDKLDVLNGAEGKKAPTLTTLKQMRTSIGQKIGAQFQDPFVKTNVSQLKRLYGTLTQDIRNTILYQRKPAILRMYDKANAVATEAYKTMESAYATKIRNLASAGQESKIVDAVIKPSMAVEDVPRIMAIAGQQGAADIRASFAQKIIDAARDRDGNFTPGGILKAMQKFGYQQAGKDKVSAILNATQIQQLKDLGTLTEAAKDVERLMKGSSPAFLINMAVKLRGYGELGAIGWGIQSMMTGDIAGAMQKFAFALGAEGASKFLASDVGQSLLKWGATRGTDFAAQAKAQGLNPDTSGGTMPPYGIPPDSRGGSVLPSGGGNSGAPSGLPVGTGGAGEAAVAAEKVGAAQGAGSAAAGMETGNAASAAGSPAASAATRIPQVEQDVISRAYQLTNENGGVTISPTGNIPTKGFSYAPSKASEFAVPKAVFTRDTAAQYYASMYDALHDQGSHFGIWEDNGKIYMDVSRVVPNEQEAVKGAIAADQLGIYDLKAGQTKYTKDYIQESDGSYRYAGANAGGVRSESAGSVGESGVLQEGGKTNEEVKAAADALVKSDKKALVAQYLKENGNVVNTDLARPLFKDVGYKGTNSAAVQDAAKQIADAAWKEGVKRKGDDAVIMMGGSGVGKSSTLAKIDPSLKNEAAVIFDGNSSSFTNTEKRINELVKAGKSVHLRYIYRPIDVSFESTIDRALSNEAEMGRIVPISDIVDNHSGSYDSLKGIIEDPKMQKLVEQGKLDIRMIDNSGTSPKELTLAKLNKIGYNKDADAEGLKAAAQKMYDEGKINEEQFQALMA